MSNAKWTKIQDDKFRQDMFDVGGIIRGMILDTSGAEEGLNVVMTILMTTVCSLSDANWKQMMNAVMSGIVGGDADEAKMERAVQTFFSSLNALRVLCEKGNSKYITKAGIEKEENKETGFSGYPGGRN